MHFQAKHVDFAGKITFFLVLGGFALIAYMAGGVDFRGYYGAAVLVTRGGNPYDYNHLAPVLEEVTGFAGNNPYFYPPWFALFFTPFTLLPFQLARLLWLMLNGTLFYASLELLQKALNWHVGGWRKWVIYLAAALTFAAYCLRSEQAGIMLLFFLSFTLIAMKRHRYVLVGLALVLFASKPQVTLPAAIMIALWLILKQQRSLWWAVFWTVALTITSSIAMPAWWQFDRSDFGTGLAYELDGPNQIAAERVLSTVYDFSEFVLHIRPPLQYVLVLGVAAFGLLILQAAWRQSSGPIEPLSAALILTFLITPYALQYDYVLLTLPFLWIVMHLHGLSPKTRGTVILLLALSLSILLWQQWSYQGYLQLLAITGAFAITIYGTTNRQRAIQKPAPTGPTA